jgi:hypothetical protein
MLKSLFATMKLLVGFLVGSLTYVVVYDMLSNKAEGTSFLLGFCHATIPGCPKMTKEARRRPLLHE